MMDASTSISMIDFKCITESFVLYTHVSDDPIVTLARQTASLLAAENPTEARQVYYKYAAMLVAEAEAHGLSGNLFWQHLCRLFLTDVNPFSLACERRTVEPRQTMCALAMQDVRTLVDLGRFDTGIFGRLAGRGENLTDYVPNKPAANPYMTAIAAIDNAEALYNALKTYYEAYGCGAVAESGMLRFTDGALCGVADADPAQLGDIVGYAEQKRLLTENTEAFLRGQAANNVLLIGARGTGKSTCVKALANAYFEQGLRLVELPKNRMHELPDVLSALSGRGKSFILYIDDLSFDESESEYKHLKSILEGGVVRRPANVLFYATSNRRHIVQEKWSDKNSGYEDETLHATDTRNEKLSLSDRFGLTITFPKPSPQLYFEIVSALAAKENLDVPEDILREKAMAWEMSQKGLSGRTARQFLNSIQKM